MKELEELGNSIERVPGFGVHGAAGGPSLALRSVDTVRRVAAIAAGGGNVPVARSTGHESIL